MTSFSTFILPLWLITISINAANAQLSFADMEEILNLEAIRIDSMESIADLQELQLIYLRQ